MSNPQRLVYPSPWKHLRDDQELRVAESASCDNWGAVPRERDLAAAVAAMPNAWFEAFLSELAELSPNRAIAVARVTERAQLHPELTEVGGFGMSPGDSQALLDLRVTIDTHLGWPSHESEQAADYVGRIKEVGETLDALKHLGRKL